MNSNWIWLPAVALTLATGCLGSDQVPEGDELGGSVATTGGRSSVTGGTFGPTGGVIWDGGFIPTGGAPGTGAVPPPSGGDPGWTGGVVWDGGFISTGGSLGTGAVVITGGVGGFPVTGGFIATGGIYTGGVIIGGYPETGGIVTGGYWPETGGVWSCDCPLPPDDRCVNVYCTADGSCRYESYASMTDADGDGASDACDCDDNNPDVYPGQENYFDGPHDVPPPIELPSPPFGGTGGISGGPGSDPYDYNCDWGIEQRYQRIAQPCVVLPGVEACEGGGWLNREDWDLPWCGESDAYQVCKYQDGTCVAVEIKLTQACR